MVYILKLVPGSCRWSHRTKD